MFRLGFPLLMAIVSVVLFAGAPAIAEDKGEKGDAHEGTVVSVTGNKLIMKADGSEHTHLLAPTAKVTCDGKDCKLDELKPGQKIRVTTKKGDKEMALKVEALDKNKEFPKREGDRN